LRSGCVGEPWPWPSLRRRRTLRASFTDWDLRRPGLLGPGCPWRCLMAAAKVSSSLVHVQPVFTDTERPALAGYLAGYRGLTREAYTLDLRQFTAWCRARSQPLFSVRRADIETFAREPKTAGGPAPPSPGACARSPGSASTPSRKNSSTTRPPRTSAGLGWTTSPTPPPWTATRSARFSSRPGSARPPSTPGNRRPACLASARRCHLTGTGQSVLHARLPAPESGLQAGSAYTACTAGLSARSRFTPVPTTPTTMPSPCAWSALLEGQGQC